MARNLSAVVLWSGLALGVWLLTLSAFSWGECIVGSACALVVGVLAVAANRVVGVTWRPTAAPLRPLLRLPVAIASDALQVLALPFRRNPVQGRFETFDIGAAGPSPAAATRRAAATLVTTATPASLVLDVDDDGSMTIHGLPTAGPRMERAFEKR